MIPPPADAALRQRLLWRIHRRYQTITERISLGTQNTGALELEFTRIADPAVVLDQVAAAEDLRERLERGQARSQARTDPLHLPYWAELWDSALGIAMWLAAGQRRMERAKVLDLGCGMGLAGTVAAALGARVTFADLEPPALLFAALNSLPWRHRVRCRRLNWQRDRLPRRFDLIIGADILYERSQWEHLEPFWRHHLAQSGAVLLGEPGRQTGALFLPWIGQRQWKLAQHQQRVSTRSTRIRLLELTTL